MKEFLYTVSKRDILVIIIIFLVALSSFGLGRISVMTAGSNQASVLMSTKTEEYAPFNNTVLPIPTTEDGGVLVGSINGTKYHFPWCSGAQRIKESNLISFTSKSAALDAGYTPASNCKGLD